MRFHPAVVALCAGLAPIWAAAAEVPRPSPDFTVNLGGGATLDLKQLRGKVVALAFMGITCPHCQRLTQVLSGIQKDYGPRGVQVVECSIDANAPALLPGFIEKYKPGFPVGFADRALAQAYLQVSVMVPFYIPKMAFIDPQGTLRFDSEQDKNYFAEMDKNIRATLDGLLKPPPAPPRPRRKK